MAFKEALEEALAQIPDQAYRDQMRELLSRPEGQTMAEGWLRQNEFDKNFNTLNEEKAAFKTEQGDFATTKQSWQKWHSDEAKPAYERAQAIEANYDKEIGARDAKIKSLSERFAGGELDEDQENSIVREVTTLRTEISQLQAAIKDGGYISQTEMEAQLQKKSTEFADNFGEIILTLDDIADAHQKTFDKRLDRRALLKFAQEKGIQNLDDAYSKMTHDEASAVKEKEIREDERKKIMSQQGHPTDGNGYATPTLGHLQHRVQKGKHDDGLPEDATVTEAAQAAAAELRAEGKVFPE
jgi:hypothetical protein